jgi:hypothetical protein
MNAPPLPSNPNSDHIEISLSDIFGFFKKYFWVLLLSGVIFGAIGYGVSYLVRIEFQATAKVLPEYGKGTGTGGLSDLASLAGISLNRSSSDALRPDLYPSILSSKPFLLKIMSTPFPVQGGKKILLPSYLNEDAKPISATQLSQSDTLIVLTKEQEQVVIDLSKRITASMDKLSGTLSIQAEMPDPILAAACASFSVNYLKTFVMEYRGGKELEKVTFLRNQVAETKQKYQRAEYALSVYRDRNQNAYTNTARIEEQRLQSDYLQAQTLYGELTRQLEAARLQAMEDTPVLKVLEPPMVPNKKSNPKRSIYALGFAILGGFITLVYILFRIERIQRKYYN